MKTIKDAIYWLIICAGIATCGFCVGSMDEMNKASAKEIARIEQEIELPARTLEFEKEVVREERTTEPSQPDAVFLDTFVATAYCESGTTASGVQTHQYKSGKPGTLAVNPDDIPLGTHVWLFDEESGEFLGEYIAEDTGGNLLRQNFVIDIFMADYDDCIEWGARRVAVWTEAAG